MVLKRLLMGLLMATARRRCRQYRESNFGQNLHIFRESVSDFLMTSEITESRAFIKSFVKEIKVKPGKATVYYTHRVPAVSAVVTAGSCVAVSLVILLYVLLSLKLYDVHIRLRNMQQRHGLDHR